MPIFCLQQETRNSPLGRDDGFEHSILVRFLFQLFGNTTCAYTFIYWWMYPTVVTSLKIDRKTGYSRGFKSWNKIDKKAFVMNEIKNECEI